MVFCFKFVTMKLKQKIIKFLFIVTIFYFYGCGPKAVIYQYQFSARTDPFKKYEVDLYDKNQYSFEFGNNEDELIEKNILFHIRKHLDSIGWEYVENSSSSELLISIQYDISKSDEKYTKRVKKGSEQVVATNWDGTAKKDKDGNIKYKNKNIYGKEERTREGYLKEYSIHLSKGGFPIWSIDISSFDKRHDLVKVSKRIIPKILEQYFLKNASRSGQYKLYVGCTDENASNYCEKCEISSQKECKY